MVNKFERLSYGVVPQTCPDLDGEMDDLLEEVNDKFDYDCRDELRELFAYAAEKIKDKCTKPLRDALVEQLEINSGLQGKLQECEYTIADLLDRRGV